jgi:glutathione S-transferase
MLKVLGRKTSANVQKVAWLCEELALPFEREDIGGPFGGNDKPEYIALNPNKRVPTIIDEDFVLWESNACISYLASKHAAGTWYPDDLQERGNAHRWLEWSTSTLAPSHAPTFMGLIRTPPEKRNLDAIAAGRDNFSAQLAIVDRYLEGNEFITGSTITIGDMPLAILSYRWFNLDIEREDYANLKRWYDSINSRPAFQKHVSGIPLS